MFNIEMLPAAHGDCLWIEYGSGTDVSRILIDGGPAYTYPTLRERILHLPASQRIFELLVITHIDADHIEGIIRLLQDAEALNCHFKRIWFNGKEQLNAVPDPAGEPLGALQGEMLSMLISEYEARIGEPVWNRDFPQRVAMVDRSSDELPVITLGECRLTLLSPDVERLLELKDHWDDELRKAGVTSGDISALRGKLESSRNLKPLGDVLGAEEEIAGVEEDGVKNFEFPADDDSDRASGLSDTLGGGSSKPGEDANFGGDASKANGSSIALLLEYPRQHPKARFILAGDAWPNVLEASIGQLLPASSKRLQVTGFKLPHHGSVANISESLLDKLSCKNYLISTSGALFRHPHSRAIELLLEKHNSRAKPCLHFNYLTATTREWSSETRQQEEGFIAHYPKGISLSL